MTQFLLDLPIGDPDCYSELQLPDGGIRPHWQALITRLAAMGPEGARRAATLSRRLVIENGVTYNVYADPQGADRPWVLDPMPMLIAADEWQVVEAGVRQRVRVLDRVLADLYGPQTLLAEGLLPPEVAFGHPNYLWPCHGVQPVGDRWMHLYGVDLARGPDGRWWVLNDRTQSPSGPGYALENRHIVSRVFPGLAESLQVRPLADFFATLRASLLDHVQDAAPPLAVVLTPGAFNETYFEHAYLARQLGLPLVEGKDLTVRGDTVFLKTLAGLRRVHAILRRVDDDFCDPVELRGDSALGVPGLLSAIRARRVFVSNALGSGVLESPAWHGFFPAIAEHLLGEPLSLPSAATWWCGEAPALEEVIDTLEDLMFLPTFPNQHFPVMRGAGLNRRERAVLIERLRTQPQAYVAQEMLTVSKAPVWLPDGLPGYSSRAMILRVYAVACGDDYVVMPGGLARIAADEYANTVSMQRGGGSKDTWVIGASPAAANPTPPAVPPRAEKTVRHDDLPSRMVENLFWLGRYAERCEGKTRLLRATLGVRFDALTWERARRACDENGVLARDADPAVALYDSEPPLGLAADLQRLVWCATQVRGRLSTENWRAMSVMQREFVEAGHSDAEPRETLDRLLLSLAGLAGFALDDMTRDHGWRLMMLGRRIERIQAMSGLLSKQLAGGRLPGQTELEWLLDIGDSTITYRTRYLATPQLAPVLSLLVQDEDNPRAIAFQCEAIGDSLERLAADLGGPPEELLDESIAGFLGADFAELNEVRGTAARIRAAASLNELSGAVARLSDRLSMRHFSHVSVRMVTT